MSITMNEDFDASQHTPSQSVPGHPPYKGPAAIKSTEILSTKDQDGGYLAVTFETPQGEIIKRYNCWSKSDKAREIAYKELSALSYATGVMRFTFKDGARGLWGARCVIEIALQKGAEAAAKGYTEVKKVFDMNGNEPGSNGATQNAGGGAGAPPPNFNQPQQQQPQPNFAQQPNPNAQQFQPQPNPGPGFQPTPPTGQPGGQGWGGQQMQPGPGPAVDSGVQPNGGWGGQPQPGPQPGPQGGGQAGWGGAAQGGVAPWGQK